MEDEILFDTTLLQELGDKKSILIVLNFFLDSSPKDIKELEIFIFEKDLKSVFNKAHKMKGSLAMLKSNIMVAELEQIEICAGVEQDQLKLEKLAAHFFRNFTILQKQLNKEAELLKTDMK